MRSSSWSGIFNPVSNIVVVTYCVSQYNAYLSFTVNNSISVVMSVFEKERRNRSYVYFQTYSDGKRSVVYLGPRDEMATWEKAERLFVEYLDQKLEDFYSRIPAEFRAKVQPKEALVRPPEAEKPRLGYPIEVEARTGAMRGVVPPDRLEKLLKKKRRRGRNGK
jgi:hypothetical protein